jgi:hypothetical protein
MTELRDDIDRALRSVPVGEAPVQRAMRDGRRLRARRRVAVLAGALAVAAVAAASPSLARLSAAPSVPVTGPTGTLVPSSTATARRDPVVTDQPPAAGAAAGTVAQGTIGGLRWAAVLSQSQLNPQGQGHTCFTAFTALAATGPASQPAAQLTQDCAAPGDLVSYTGSNPAGFTGSICSAGPGGGPAEVMLGAVAPDVVYLVLTFTDGQQLKLIPVTSQGRRYVAWVAPAWMNVESLTAHLGSPNFDNGQTMTAVPFEPPDGEAPVFGLWLTPGQAVPPRATGVIGHGTGDGRPWSVSMYEGPWGTCIVATPGGIYCVPVDRTATAVLGGWGGDPAGPGFGSAAPGVASVRVSLSNGKSVQVEPVTVGNERLFAFWVGAGVSPVGWTTYDAAGRVTGTHSMT